MEVVQRASFMVSEVLGCEEEQMFITGIVLMFDFSGFGLDHFTAMPMAMMKKLKPCWEVLKYTTKFQRQILKNESFGFT